MSIVQDRADEYPVSEYLELCNKVPSVLSPMQNAHKSGTTV